MAAAFAAPLLIPRSSLGGDGRVGANDRIGVGAIGVGYRAALLLDQLPEDARIVALCDCNLPRAEDFRKRKNASWPLFQNYHQLLERKDIDAVIVATREHQRVLPCIHACQAGKDIYAEKPLCMYIHEGRALVQTVRKCGRILQVGSQQRSMAMNRIACEFVRSGGLGKLTEVRAVNYTGPGPLPKQPLPAQPVPTGLDWDMWLNQAAWRPYNSGAMGASLDLAGGEMTNWGAHGIDQVQWALGMDGTGPVETWPISAGLNGQVGMRYANGLELKFILDKGPSGGAVFVGEKGKLEINRNKFTSNPKEIAAELLKKVNVAEEEYKWSDKLALWQARWHMQNWIDCMRTRQLPAADVEIGHRSISVCHLANITRYVGRKLQWDPATERFVHDEEANRWVVRERRKGYELPT
jgi:predicted dehydrogenase